MVDEELKFLVALTMIDDIGPVAINGLVDAFGTPSAVFRTSAVDLAKIRGISPGIAAAIKAFDGWSGVEKQFQWTRKTGATIVTAWDEDYPPLLRYIYDRPILLYAKGRLKKDDINIAMVGSRSASAHGIYITDKLSRELALKGLTVVSGMARGIDSAAHTGALAAKGRTVAVLGSGLDVIYPPENRKLYEKIAERGAIVTEYPFGTDPLGFHFPRRNRIISGLSLGVVVVEATEKSGSLITARIALEQGREVFAIPGSIDSGVSRGTNKLIKDGAKLVQDVDDILGEILPQVDFEKIAAEDEGKKETGSGAAGNLHPSEERILRHLSRSPMHIDSLIFKSGVAVHEILAILLSLEVQGYIEQLPGKYFRLPAEKG